MRELEIALAIALSFLVFSTFASMILELFYRLLNTRFERLKVMLSDLCEKELSAFAESNGNGSGNNSKQGSTTQDSSPEQNSLSKMFKNLLNNLKTSWQKLSSMLRGKPHKVYDNQFCLEMVSLFVKDTQNNHTMTTTQFIERLATTDIGKEITRYSQDELTTLVNRLGRRYDTFCEEATLSFKKNSEVLTMAISVVMAFVLNINVVTLGNTFIENRALTNELVAQTTVIMERAEQQQNRMQELLNKEQPPPTEDLQKSLDRLRESYQSMEKMQLPIGWSRSSLQFFETEAAKLGCGNTSDEAATNPYNKCKDNLQKMSFWAIAGIGWLITTLITGLLIGLGGPFWLDVVKQISVFRSALSSATTDKNQSQTQAPGNSKEPPNDLVKIFEETVKAGELIANTNQPPLPPAPSRVRLG